MLYERSVTKLYVHCCSRQLFLTCRPQCMCPTCSATSRASNLTFLSTSSICTSFRCIIYNGLSHFLTPQSRLCVSLPRLRGLPAFRGGFTPLPSSAVSEGSQLSHPIGIFIQWATHRTPAYHSALPLASSETFHHSVVIWNLNMFRQPTRLP